MFGKICDFCKFTFYYFLADLLLWLELYVGTWTDVGYQRPHHSPTKEQSPVKSGAGRGFL